MDDQLWKYLDRADRSDARCMTFIYCIIIMMNLAISIPGMLSHFKPSVLLGLNDIHTAVAVMYLLMNLMLIYQIKQHHDETNRSYLLVCYSVLIMIDIITEQIIVLCIVQSPYTLTRLFSRGNILFLVVNVITIAIYLNRYFYLKRRYAMLITRKDVSPWTGRN